MSAKRDEAFKQWKNGFIRHYEPLTSVEAFVGGWNSRDAEVAELKATLDAIGRHSNKVNAEIAELRRLLGVALDLLVRYRNETPLGNQPHMITDSTDKAITEIEGALK